MFVAAGQKPANWCYSTSASAKLRAQAERTYRLAHLPPRVRALALKHPEVKLFLHRSAKTTNRAALAKLAVNPENIAFNEVLQATQDILVDQNGRWARFTVGMNQDEYNFIMSKTLWTKAGQASAGTITFPTTPTGAMEFKSAWKLIGANDIASHFITASAIVYNDVSGRPRPGQNPVTVGLVGLHITHKSATQPNWIWSTFEQVGERGRQVVLQPELFHHPMPSEHAEPSANPKTALELNQQGKPNYKPAQVVWSPDLRADPELSVPEAACRNTVGLLSAHQHAIDTGEASTRLNRRSSGNSVRKPSSRPDVYFYSCMTCHQVARLAGAPKVSADFSYMLQFAPQQ